MLRMYSTIKLGYVTRQRCQTRGPRIEVKIKKVKEVFNNFSLNNWF